MTFFVAGVLDILGGTILFYSPGSISLLGLVMIAKGAWSIVSDLFWILGRK